MFLSYIDTHPPTRKYLGTLPYVEAFTRVFVFTCEDHGPKGEKGGQMEVRRRSPGSLHKLEQYYSLDFVFLAVASFNRLMRFRFAVNKRRNKIKGKEIINSSEDNEDLELVTF